MSSSTVIFVSPSTSLLFEGSAYSNYYASAALDAILLMITDDSFKILGHALVLSRLDYCISLFVGLLKKDIHRLQVIQNAAARLKFLKKPSDDATVFLKKLHWLPISQRIDFKLIVLTYRCLHGQATPYLSRHIVPYVPGRSLWSDRLGRISVPPKPKLLNYGQRAFSHAAFRLWNSSIDSSCALAPNFPVFKSLLKTHLHATAYL